MGNFGGDGGRLSFGDLFARLSQIRREKNRTRRDRNKGLRSSTITSSINNGSRASFAEFTDEIKHFDRLFIDY